MEVTAKELRGRPGSIIEQAIQGTEIVITLRGKRIARLVPYASKPGRADDGDDEIFGMWEGRDEESVEDYVRAKRKGRAS